MSLGPSDSARLNPSQASHHAAAMRPGRSNWDKSAGPRQLGADTCCPTCMVQRCAPHDIDDIIDMHAAGLHVLAVEFKLT